jgi:hygromycin-B 7''-O-kinase
MCVARHQGLGLAPEWLARIEPFLESVELPDVPSVLLHTEILREHLLVSPEGDRFTGLFDFEPAIRGAAEYEFVSVAVSCSAGDRRFLGRTLRAYGVEPDGPFRRRMMAWTLLHYYSNMREYLDRLPPPAEPANKAQSDEPTFESLADRWYATE